MAGEIRFTEVSAPSVYPATGKHQFYTGTNGKLNRQDAAGASYPIAENLLTVLSADYTLSNVNTAQKAFNASTNGRVDLPASSAFLLEALYMITNTGTVSHTWATLFAGTATLTALDYMVSGRSATTTPATITAESSAFQSNGAGSLPTTALVVTAASVSATENVLLRLQGTLRINAAGTFVPQIQLSAATGVAATMKRGSYIKLTPIGSNTATQLGSWS